MRRRLVVVAALLAAACGSPEPPPAEAPSVVTSTSVGHGSLAYCLSQHGVPAPPGPPSGPPPGVDPQTWDDALQECSSLAPGPAE
ncbi:hypothetical protein [Mycolicibacterium sp.]|uniref:hypothetical protein n=1 Tax=Mycolicibacterium sp. TaxID=2320850 RepID=UPI003D0A8A02